MLLITRWKTQPISLKKDDLENEKKKIRNLVRELVRRAYKS
jgi:hypothetical protein